MGDEYGLESNFISTYSGWDEIEVANFIFYDAVLKVDIGQLKAGTVLEYFNLNCSDSFVVLGIDENTSHKFRLNASVGEELADG